MHAEKRQLLDAGDYEDRVIKEVHRSGDGSHYSVDLEGNTGFARDFGQFEPKAGDAIRLFTRGSFIRGVDLNGIEVDFKTEAELDAEHAALVAKSQADRKAKFNEDRERLNRDFSQLPPSFQTRIQIFRDHCPDFRWEFESYELFACMEAVKIADHLRMSLGNAPTEDDIRTAVTAFQQDADKQKDVISEEHSGNTFGSALRLAQMHLLDESGLRVEGLPEIPLVIQMHGALTPLVGCEDYGCIHPRPWPYELPDPRFVQGED